MKQIVCVMICLAVAACSGGGASKEEHSGTSHEEAPNVKPAVIKPDSYLIYFDWDRAELNTDGQAKMQQVAKEIKAKTDVKHVSLNGHTDTSGNADYNMTLSEKRAERVKRWLVEAGLSEKLMKLFAFGETDTAIDTGDNVKEPRNRRVEVFVE